MKFKITLTLITICFLSSCQEVARMGELAEKQSELTEQKEREAKTAEKAPPKNGIVTKENKRSNTTVEIEYKDGKKMAPAGSIIQMAPCGKSLTTKIICYTEWPGYTAAKVSRNVWCITRRGKSTETLFVILKAVILS